MRIRFLVSIASATWSYEPDQVDEVPDDEARAHIASGNAVAVEDVPVESTASRAPAEAERAVRPSVRRAR